MGISELLFEDMLGNGAFGAMRTVRLRAQPEKLYLLKCIQKTKLV
jgi:hypothetical protein